MEVLKAQAKSYQIRELPAPDESGPPEKTVKEAPEKIRRVDPKFIKKDLMRTLVLAVLALAFITLVFVLK